MKWLSVELSFLLLVSMFAFGGFVSIYGDSSQQDLTGGVVKSMSALSDRLTLKEPELIKSVMVSVCGKTKLGSTCEVTGSDVLTTVELSYGARPDALVFKSQPQAVKHGKETTLTCDDVKVDFKDPFETEEISVSFSGKDCFVEGSAVIKNYDGEKRDKPCNKEGQEGKVWTPAKSINIECCAGLKYEHPRSAFYRGKCVPDETKK